MYNNTRRILEEYNLQGKFKISTIFLVRLIAARYKSHAAGERSFVGFACKGIHEVSVSASNNTSDQLKQKVNKFSQIILKQTQAPVYK